jgi:hypothetical protein
LFIISTRKAAKTLSFLRKWCDMMRFSHCWHGFVNSIQTLVIPLGKRDVLNRKKKADAKFGSQYWLGDPNGIRTRVTGVRDRVGAYSA